MATKQVLLLFYVVALALFLSSPSPSLGATLDTYIVSVQRPENLPLSDSKALEDYYKSFLPTTTAANGERRLVYSYSEVFSGFAAKLSPEELKSVEAKEGFLHAYPDRLIPLLTTHTPDFLGLHPGRGLWRQGTNMGEGIIIGMLDTGNTFSHPSFSAAGIPPPPSKWKGSCVPSEYCNNKIIGAKSFMEGTVTTSPDDDVGHGTHTASTAAGGFLKGTSVEGLANGTASGIAPRAHLAIYKVCNEQGCTSSDILAGINEAVADGVDVLSISLGSNSPTPLPMDPIGVATFAASQKGIFVSCAAGNSGPNPETLSNDSPWILTVAASTMDRAIRATVKLPDGREFHGESLTQPRDFPTKPLPLFYPADAAGSCEATIVDREVSGKLVVCQGGRSEKGENLKTYGAAGLITMNDESIGATTFVTDHALPATNIGYADGMEIIDYVSNHTGARASLLFSGTVLGTSPAPAVAAFSSRGPSMVNSYIIKPDISGPGVNVLAAWPSSKGDSGPANFTIISGTSMSTPHLSGVAALLKKAHPDWSPAAIKSAIMTTADVLDRDGKPIMNEKLEPALYYHMGAGQVNPSRAANPGLVYDTDPADYIPFLCGLPDMGDTDVSAIVGRRVKCSAEGTIEQWELNYPSISVPLNRSGTVVVNRTVTNVGLARATYTAEVDQSPGVKVTVTPSKLVFLKAGEKKSFTVTFKDLGEKKGLSRRPVLPSLRWVFGKQVVRSPLHWYD